MCVFTPLVDTTGLLVNNAEKAASAQRSRPGIDLALACDELPLSTTVDPTYQSCSIDKPDPPVMETHRCRCTPLFPQEGPVNTTAHHRTFLAMSLERARLRATNPSPNNQHQFHPSCFLRMAKRPNVMSLPANTR